MLSDVPPKPFRRFQPGLSGLPIAFALRITGVVTWVVHARAGCVFGGVEGFLALLAGSESAHWVVMLATRWKWEGWKRNERHAERVCGGQGSDQCNAKMECEGRRMNASNESI